MHRVPWADLAVAIPAELRRHLDRTDGNPLPERTRIEVEAALTTRSPDAAELLARLRSEASPDQSPGDRGKVVREQRDAVALGLEIVGLDSRELLDIQPDESDASVPFLRDWKRRRVSEAASIRHDATAFDDWLRRETGEFDVVTFEAPDDPARRVTIFYADKEDLERQTGTDLVYYRHDRPGFILVQYKRMRAGQTPGAKSAYYPDEQLRKELDRFRDLPNAEAATNSADWRLTEDAFFVKLVKDDLAKPAENRLVRGMYLPLSLVDLLLSDSDAGLLPRSWSQESLKTYLSNEEFLQMAKQGLIGTRGPTTEHLQETVRRSFAADRGVVVALDQTDRSQARRLRHG